MDDITFSATMDGGHNLEDSDWDSDYGISRNRAKDSDLELLEQSIVNKIQMQIGPLKDIIKTQIDDALREYSINLRNDYYFKEAFKSEIIETFVKFLLLCKSSELAEPHYNIINDLNKVSELYMFTQLVRQQMTALFNYDGSFEYRHDLNELSLRFKDLCQIVGLKSEVTAKEYIENLRKEMKPIFDMIADPQLALSERVKSFELK